MGKNKKNMSDQLSSTNDSKDSNLESPIDRALDFVPQKKHVIHQVDISWSTIFKVLITLSVIFLGSKLLQVGLILFFAFVIASALMPLVKTLQEKGLAQLPAIVLSYLSILVVIVILAVVVITPVTNQFEVLSADIPNLVKDSVEGLTKVTNSIPLVDLNSTELYNSLSDWYHSIVAGDTVLSGVQRTFSTISSVGSIFSSLLFSVVISVYILWDHDTFTDLIFLRIIDDKKRELVRELIADVEFKLGRWLISQITLMFLIGVMTWIVLLILGIKFALPLAVIAGTFTVVPSIGPLASSVPSILVALITGGVGSALLVAVGYIVIQQIEGTLITPRIMGNVVGLKPVAVVIGILTGFSLAGILGAMITVPVLVLGKIAYDFYIKYQKLKVIGE